ncbi:hypothetical protein SAMN04489727_1791 [Amycolatopsis tolypomycina]|uniref:Uncharacterized protein n=2 Tax=Amycolatopsis tolypomycina TaxID=208445 RepID=A0A1H4JDF6_9PSEU|nr:hypothetical protein SAMN04489727_1791 [Amycolatopsis tolypomycina]
MGVSALLDPACVELPHQHLVDRQLWSRLVRRIHADLEFQHAFGKERPDAAVRWAERVLDQALAFLVLCADGQNGPYAPSALVDIGWHNFLMYTAEYAEFCARHAGRFIHHRPNDDEAGSEVPLVAHTAASMRALGLVVDDELWPSEALGEKCYACSDGGCRS